MLVTLPLRNTATVWATWFSLMLMLWGQEGRVGGGRDGVGWECQETKDVFAGDLRPASAWKSNLLCHLSADPLCQSCGSFPCWPVWSSITGYRPSDLRDLSLGLRHSQKAGSSLMRKKQRLCYIIRLTGFLMGNQNSECGGSKMNSVKNHNKHHFNTH